MTQIPPLFPYQCAFLQREPDVVFKPEAEDKRLETRRAEKGVVPDPLWSKISRRLVEEDGRDQDTMVALGIEVKIPEQNVLLIIQEPNQVAAVPGRAFDDPL